MKRLLGFMTIAFIPVVLLSALYPEKVTEVPKMEERYDSVAGSDLVVFVRDGCPHCAAFEAYAIEHNLDVEYHEVSQIDAQKLFSQLQERAPALNQGVPTIVLNGHVSQGYDTDEDGDALAARLAACQASTSGCLSFEEFVQSTKTVSVDAVGESFDED